MEECDKGFVGVVIIRAVPNSIFWYSAEYEYFASI